MPFELVVTQKIIAFFSLYISRVWLTFLPGFLKNILSYTMSIPYEGTQDILFHRGAQNNTGKINNYHEELIGNSTAKLDELHINQNKANDTTDSNYDLSYYFHHSSSISTVSSAEEQFSNNNYRRGRSLSICSTLSINATSQPQLLPSPKTPPPPSTPHQEGFNIVSDENKVQYYKKHSDKSSKKAYQFFGEQVKLDIPIKEIKREGLKTLLHSNVPLGYFLYHLLDEYSSENLVRIYNRIMLMFLLNRTLYFL